MQNVFYLHDESCWPSEVLELLTVNLASLRQFFDEEKRINKLVSYRQPENQYRAEVERVRQEMDGIISELSVVGFHCTRLHEAEIASILTGGMEPASEDLLGRRINARVADGSLPPDVAELLLAENNARDTNRSGRIWFAFNQRLLRDESGVGRLFRYWGGESLYRLHQNNPRTTPCLKRIGGPCIIEVAVPVATIAGASTQLGDKMLNGFLLRRRVMTGNGDDAEGYVRQAIPPSQVRRVVRRTDSDFDRLTGYDKYRHIEE